MLKRITDLVWIAALLLSLVAQALAFQPVQAGSSTPGSAFVQRDGPNLRLNRKIFRFAGTNNYYLMYKSPFMVDDVINTAAASGFRVLRMWGSLEIGNQDGSNSINGKSDGIYFQYWDGSAPAYNDGPNGLEKLDYAVYRAGQAGLKLVIPFVNNWNAFGGIDQYVRWADGSYHDQFFTDPQIRQWYKDWIAHLLNRTNSYTGVQYKDDPTIMTWELANEPRCLSAGAYPRSDSCTTETLIAWADEMSTFIKSIDTNHLVSVGDEGFYCIPGATDWTENCGEGVDTLAFTALPNIDVMSFHLYPDHWGKTAEWGTAWIERHFAEARQLNKPAMLGEFGWQEKSTRNPVFRAWTKAVFDSQGAGALYWILSGRQDGDGYYADYDGFTVYCPSPVCMTLSNFARAMLVNKDNFFPPVADNDTAETEFETPVALAITANDIAYGGASLLPDRIDLDPAARGRQVNRAVTGGTFALQPDGTVLFTPDAGFVGTAQVAYILFDSLGRVSNEAAISVTVKPLPTAPVVIFSFEDGTQGWRSVNGYAVNLAQTADFATHGAYGLRLESSTGDWYGTSFPAPLDLSSKTHLKWDLQTHLAGTSNNVALQLGDSWTWCEATWGWVNSGTTTTIDVDLTSLSCYGTYPGLSKVQAIWIWVSAGGVYHLDYVRAE